MKSIILSMVAASAIALSAPVYASDPCASVLCLYGKAIGSGGGSECKSAEKDFFNIIKKKKGSIRWSKTFDARKAFLNQCTTADPAAISKIMSKFGRSGVNHEKLIIIPTTLLLNACSHAPEPAQAKGGWYELNTTIEQVRADTYYNGVILQQPVSQPNSTVQYSNDNYLKRKP